MTQDPEKNIENNKDAVKSPEDVAWQTAAEAIEKDGPPPKEVADPEESGYPEEYKGDEVTPPEEVKRLLQEAKDLGYEKVRREIFKNGETVEIKANVPEKEIAEIHTVEDLNKALQQNNVDHGIQDGIKDAFSRAETLLGIYGSSFAYGKSENILKGDLTRAREKFENEIKFAQMPGRLKEILMPKIDELFERLTEQKKIEALEEKRKGDEFNAAERKAREELEEQRRAENSTRQQVTGPKKSWYKFWK
jgi:hypothetical protein